VLGDLGSIEIIGVDLAANGRECVRRGLAARTQSFPEGDTLDGGIEGHHPRAIAEFW